MRKLALPHLSDLLKSSSLCLFFILLLFFFIIFEGISVMSNNADEISIETINHTGCEERPEEVLFLGQTVVSSLFTSGNDFPRFVPAVEVNYLPDGYQGV